MDASTKIFIVEDDLFYGSLLLEIFKIKNFKKVKRIGSGKKCLESLHEKPDVIVLDYNLGDMNGVEVFEKIKSVDPSIKVIFLSAQENGKVAIKSLRLGAYEYFEKSEPNIRKMVQLVQRIANEKLFKLTGISKKKKTKEAGEEHLIGKYISLIDL